MNRVYRRIETIDQIVTKDTVRVTDDLVERVGEPELSEATYSIEWRTAEGQLLPEASAIYNFLESEFMKISAKEGN
jgi:hypothetical protein